MTPFFKNCMSHFCVKKEALFFKKKVSYDSRESIRSGYRTYYKFSYVLVLYVSVGVLHSLNTNVPHGN